MGDLDLPPFMLAEREGLVAEIHEAFSKVGREGGVSWSEADVIDDYGSPEQRAAARAKDRDTRWQDLVGNPSWNPADASQWCFLDAIGFRYYLPAAMIRAVRQGHDMGILFHLSLSEDDLRDHKPSQWMALNLPQRLCVKRFLQYMGIVAAWSEAQDNPYSWFAALKSYWGASRKATQWAEIFQGLPVGEDASGDDKARRGPVRLSLSSNRRRRPRLAGSPPTLAWDGRL